MRQSIFGGGGNILDKTHDVNNPKVFEKFNLNYFISCSQERLLRVKRGENLLEIAKSQQEKYEDLVKSLRSSCKSCQTKPNLLKKHKNPLNKPTEKSLSKTSLDSVNINRVLLYSSSKISPLKKTSHFTDSKGMSEIEKLANLRDFFVEKFAVIGNELNEPALRTSLDAQRNNFIEQINELKRKDSLRVSSDEKRVKSQDSQKFLTSAEKKLLEVDQKIKEDLNAMKSVELRLSEYLKDNREIKVWKKGTKVESKIKHLMEIDPQYLVHYKRRKNTEPPSLACRSYSNISQNSKNSLKSGKRSILNKTPVVGASSKKHLKIWLESSRKD